MTTREPRAICRSVSRTIALWAQRTSDVHGLALVGSWASDTPHLDSDIDLIVLVTDPQTLRGVTELPGEIALPVPIMAWTDVSYGAHWSRRYELEDQTGVELGFCPREWASCSPIDPGTARIMRDGCTILYDPTHLFGRLCAQVAQQRGEAQAAKRRG